MDKFQNTWGLNIYKSLEILILYKIMNQNYDSIKASFITEVLKEAQ